MITATQPGRMASGRWTGLAGLMLLAALSSGMIQARDVTTADPQLVKAAYLRNFARYVTWPANAFEAADTPWCIGILGDDPLGEVLENAVKGRREQGRSFEIARADTLDQLRSCQIIFVAYRDTAKRRAVLAELKRQPVLTVGDAPDFLQEGGIIRFRIRDRVEMSINLDQARAVSLKVQTQMLEVAREVLENGAVSKLR
jgi:hypothetical protein